MRKGKESIRLASQYKETSKRSAPQDTFSTVVDTSLVSIRVAATNSGSQSTSSTEPDEKHLKRTLSSEEHRHFSEYEESDTEEFLQQREDWVRQQLQFYDTRMELTIEEQHERTIEDEQGSLQKLTSHLDKVGEDLRECCKVISENIVLQVNTFYSGNFEKFAKFDTREFYEPPEEEEGEEKEEGKGDNHNRPEKLSGIRQNGNRKHSISKSRSGYLTMTLLHLMQKTALAGLQRKLSLDRYNEKTRKYQAPLWKVWGIDCVSCKTCWNSFCTNICKDIANQLRICALDCQPFRFSGVRVLWHLTDSFQGSAGYEEETKLLWSLVHEDSTAHHEAVHARRLNYRMLVQKMKEKEEESKIDEALTLEQSSRRRGGETPMGSDTSPSLSSAGSERMSELSSKPLTPRETLQHDYPKLTAKESFVWFKRQRKNSLDLKEINKHIENTQKDAPLKNKTIIVPVKQMVMVKHISEEPDGRLFLYCTIVRESIGGFSEIDFPYRFNEMAAADHEIALRTKRTRKIKLPKGLKENNRGWFNERVLEEMEYTMTKRTYSCKIPLRKKYIYYNSPCALIEISCDIELSTVVQFEVEYKADIVFPEYKSPFADGAKKRGRIMEYISSGTRYVRSAIQNLSSSPNLGGPFGSNRSDAESGRSQTSMMMDSYRGEFVSDEEADRNLAWREPIDERSMGGLKSRKGAYQLVKLQKPHLSHLNQTKFFSFITPFPSISLTHQKKGYGNTPRISISFFMRESKWRTKFLKTFLPLTMVCLLNTGNLLVDQAHHDFLSHLIEIIFTFVIFMPILFREDVRSKTEGLGPTLVISLQSLSLLLAMAQRVFLVKKEDPYVWVRGQQELRDFLNTTQSNCTHATCQKRELSPLLTNLSNAGKLFWNPDTGILMPAEAINTTSAFIHDFFNNLRHALEGPLDHRHTDLFVDDEEMGWGLWRPDIARIITFLSIFSGAMALLVPVGSKIYLVSFYFSF
eukprot:g3727.t1